jgi:hypothetical protein
VKMRKFIRLASISGGSNQTLEFNSHDIGADCNQFFALLNAPEVLFSRFLAGVGQIKGT